MSKPCLKYKINQASRNYTYFSGAVLDSALGGHHPVIIRTFRIEGLFNLREAMYEVKDDESE